MQKKPLFSIKDSLFFNCKLNRINCIQNESFIKILLRRGNLSKIDNVPGQGFCRSIAANCEDWW